MPSRNLARTSGMRPLEFRLPSAALRKRVVPRQLPCWNLGHRMTAALSTSMSNVDIRCCLPSVVASPRLMACGSVMARPLRWSALLQRHLETQLFEHLPDPSATSRTSRRRLNTASCSVTIGTFPINRGATRGPDRHVHSTARSTGIAEGVRGNKGHGAGHCRDDEPVIAAIRHRPR